MEPRSGIGVRVRVKFRVRVRVRVRVRIKVRVRVRVKVRVKIRVRVRRTVGMADPGNGGPREWRTGIVEPVSGLFAPRTFRRRQ